MRFFKFIQELADRASTWITVVGTVGTAVLTVLLRSIAAISQYGWGAVILVAIGITCVIALAFSAAIASWRYFHPLHLHPPLTVASREALVDKGEEFLNATQGDEHTRLELFVAEFLAPACWAQIGLQILALGQLCANRNVLEIATEGLWVNFDEGTRGALALARSFGLSPLPEVTNGELIDCVAKLENGGYFALCNVGDTLAAEAGDMYWSNAQIADSRKAWRNAHSNMVREYNSLKREPKFLALYRPQLKSRWGDLPPF
jgi:hypothetical protein